MSESVHAVLAKQHHEKENHHHNAVTQNEQEVSDEDDDIDIIGKFGHNGPPAPQNSLSFQVMPAPSPSAGSNSYLLSPTSTFPTISNYRLLDNRGPLTNPAARSNIFEPTTLEPLSHTGRNSFQQDMSPKQDDRQSNRSRSGSNLHAGHQDASPEAHEWATDATLVPARDRLRRALRFYFMSPIEKWRIKGRVPWKLLFQLIKIILVTTQLIIFGNSITDYRAADNSMIISMHNLFLLNWDTARDFKVVPPDTGPYAVYTKDDVYSHADFAIKNYANISALTVGAFGYQLKSESDLTNQTQSTQSLNIEACFHRYANATLNPSLGNYFIDASVIEQCISINYPYPPGSDQWNNFSFFKFIEEKDPAQNNLESLLLLTIKLPLRTILLNTIAAFNTPQCFDLDVSVNFDNKAHSGQIMIYMLNHNKQIDCHGNLEDHSRETHSLNLHIGVNFVVLFLCIFSLLLCIRSIWRGQGLRRRTARFFALVYRRTLDAKSSLHFIDGWILMILLNDCLLITGTSINLLRQLNLIGPRKLSLRPIDFDNLCSALLGVGNLLVWMGILRYLAFFSKYNVLIVTLKHALPRVLRFLLCVLVLYGGFCFSGWIILGPYHWKFQTLARTSECLFALMNGDDVFATFAYLQRSSPFVWWFSRLYLYCFVLLFIYVVLSLFIAILMDSYETIKDYYGNKRRRKMKGMLMSNDQLARFLAASEAEDEADEDWWASYRMSLLHDEEIEFQSSGRQRVASGTSGDAVQCPCCMCHCWAHLASPLACIRSAFSSLRCKWHRGRHAAPEDRSRIIN